jgi:hypothetical protein
MGASLAYGQGVLDGFGINILKITRRTAPSDVEERNKTG